MSCSTRSLREQRAKLIHEARSIADLANRVGASPSPGDEIQVCRMLDEADKIEQRYLDIERLEKAEKSVAEVRGRQSEPGQPGQYDRTATAEYRSAYDDYLRTGEQRSLSAENDPQGGYLSAPVQMVDTLIKGLDDQCIIRQLSTKIALPTSQSLGVPTIANDPADGEWTSEVLTGGEDSALSFGKRELAPRPIAKKIKVSNKLLRVAPSAGQIVVDRLAYKFAITEERAFLLGTGMGQPLGVFTPSSDGISTARDVSADNTATEITIDGLMNALYSLKSQYLQAKSIRWLFHRDAIKQLRKLKDLDGRYIWQPSVVADTPDLLLGVPVIMSEYCPNTFTTGQYVGIVGDFSNYWIADGLSLAIQRLVELYAEQNQTGFIGRLETDGMPVLEEAFARVKLA